MSTYKSLLQDATLKLNQSSSARIDAEILLCHAAQLPKEKLLANLTESVCDKVEIDFWQYVHFRSQGMPVAYIIGKKAFWDFEVEVNPHVLIPRPETECIVEVLLNMNLPDEGVLFELGTGSGALAIALSRVLKNWEIWASDIEEQALRLARLNAKNLGANIHFLRSNWLRDFKGKADIIVSNPPYIDKNSTEIMLDVQAHEPPVALFSAEQGLADLKAIISTSVQYLNKGGFLGLEHGYDQAKIVRESMKKAGFRHINTNKDLSGLERVTFASL